MARGPKASYSTAYRRRVERKLGMSIETAYARGIPLQGARGHKPREHVTRRINRINRGNLTAQQYSWFQRQSTRLIVSVDNARRYFESLPSYIRDDMIEEQRRYRRNYLSRGHKRSMSLDELLSNLDFEDEEIDNSIATQLLFYH